MTATSELVFPHPEPPAAASWREVAPGVCWLRLPLPFALDHVNLWLLQDDEGWTLVDTGIALPQIKALWDDLLAALGQPLRRIVATHFHPDHLGLARWLQARSGASLSMSAAEYLTAHLLWNELGGFGTAPMLAQFRSHGLNATGLAALAERGNQYRAGVDGLPECYDRLQEGDRLVVGGVEWQVIVGHGHSPEHVCLYAPKRDVLISGDMLLPRISTNVSVFAVTPGADVLGEYLASLERLAAIVPASALVLPSHGLPFVGIPARVAALRAHHAERLACLEAACTTPKSAADVLETLFPRQLDTHQLMFAMGEAIAHLNHLERAGRLQKQIGTDGKIVYLRKSSANQES
jgi:glyoxylase-like metal-dependent hydrolase (beta-lactamase superfamily II)